jgi:hypothetical protein
MIHQASHQGLQHPLKWKFPFPSATVIIWVSQYDHELTTFSRVYSSRSYVCPLFHPRNHTLLLRESLALSPKSPGSSPPLLMGGSPLKVNPYLSWYSEYYNAFTELVAREMRRGDRPPHSMDVWIWKNMGRQGILCLLAVKKWEWESPPSILVTRNPNWSQRSGTETGCVKGRY